MIVQEYYFLRVKKINNVVFKSFSHFLLHFLLFMLFWRKKKWLTLNVNNAKHEGNFLVHKRLIFFYDSRVSFIQGINSRFPFPNEIIVFCRMASYGCYGNTVYWVREIFTLTDFIEGYIRLVLSFRKRAPLKARPGSCGDFH